MSNCFALMAKRESLAVTLLTALVAALSALMLTLMLVSPAFAFSDSNAEMRELAVAPQPAAAARLAVPKAPVDGRAQTRPVGASARAGAARG